MVPRRVWSGLKRAAAGWRRGPWPWYPIIVLSQHPKVNGGAYRPAAWRASRYVLSIFATQPERKPMPP